MAKKTVEQMAEGNPFKNAVEGGHEKREVALRIAQVALPEIVAGQQAAAARMNDLLTRDGIGNVAKINDVLNLDANQVDWSIRQMAEAIADPNTLFALSAASDRVEDILWAKGIETKMKVAFGFLREAGVDISRFEGVVHRTVAERVRKIALAIAKQGEPNQFDELIALMGLPYNQVSADVIRSALGYGIKATADSRATISLADQRVGALIKAARKMDGLLAQSKKLKDDYEKAALPVGDIMDRAGAVTMARENGLVRPEDLNAIVAQLQADMDSIRGGRGKAGLRRFDRLTKLYLGDNPSSIEDASQAMAGSHSMMVATNANARMMIQKAESYYSLAAAEGLRMLMTHETLTTVMNYVIGRLNREQRDEAMQVVSDMVRLINQGRYEEAFVLGAERRVLPREYAQMKLAALTAKPEGSAPAEG